MTADPWVVLRLENPDVISLQGLVQEVEAKDPGAGLGGEGPGLEGAEPGVKGAGAGLGGI